MSIEIKRLQKEEIQDFKQLFEKTTDISVHSPFNGHSVKEFEWSFFSDDCEQAIYIVAFDTKNDKILATQAGIVIPMLTPEGKVCNTIKGEDTLVNIDGMVAYPKRDILKELYDRLDSEATHLSIEFTWGYNNIKQTSKRIGFNAYTSSQKGIYVLRPFKSFQYLKSLNKDNGVKQKLQIFGLSFISYIKALALRNKRTDVSCKKITLDQVDESKLLSFLPKNLYSIYLNKSFLKWRIQTNPSKLKYSILELRNNVEVVSYLIYSTKEEAVYFLEQFLFKDKLSFKQKQEIIKSTLCYFKKKNAATVRAMGFEHNRVNKEEVNILKKAGFVFIKRGLCFRFKSNNKEIRLENIYLNRLNTQGIY